MTAIAIAAMPLPTANPKRVAEVALPQPNPKRPKPAAGAPGTFAAPTFSASQPTPPVTFASVAPALPAPSRAPLPAAAAGAEGPPLPARAPDPPRRFDYKAALSPILSLQLSSGDTDALRAAVRTAYAGRDAEARAAIAGIKNPTAQKLARWYYYRSSGVQPDPGRIEAFRQANGDWPSGDLLRRRAEQALFNQNAAPTAVAGFFGNSAPISPAGMAALARAHLAKGETAKARILMRRAYTHPDLDADVEKAILEVHGDLLSDADHRARIDRLLYKDRTSLIPAAQRIAARLGDADKKKIEARAAVMRRAGNAEKLLNALPADVQKDVGVLFSRIQWLRRNDREPEAWKLLLDLPKDPALLLDLDEWWIERRINVRGALNRGEPETAYQIARDHGPLTGDNYLDAEFLAGWIALRFLDRPQEAKRHFVNLRTASAASDDVARAEYWLGRAEKALGDGVAATLHFSNAAQYGFHYYGQLGAQALAERHGDELFPPTPEPTAADVRRLLARDAAKALGILRSAGLESLAPLFLLELARNVNTPGEGALVAELARHLDLPQSSVRLSRIAISRGLPLTTYAYPTDVLPYYQPLNGRVESALVHSLSRQESEFNAAARSAAGARGLLQLMPATARGVARSYKVRYSLARLTSDPSFNMQLGTAFLRDLLDNYDGSYVLALVAYNAGPGRVRDWTERFGDPRHPDVDPIDWVEQIPFTETRRYVQKILEGVQVYRARLQGPDGALKLAEDLHRGTWRSQPGRTAAAAHD